MSTHQKVDVKHFHKDKGHSSSPKNMKPKIQAFWIPKATGFEQTLSSYLLYIQFALSSLVPIILKVAWKALIVF